VTRTFKGAIIKRSSIVDSGLESDKNRGRMIDAEARKMEFQKIGECAKWSDSSFHPESG
jgi:hypothetical protein